MGPIAQRISGRLSALAVLLALPVVGATADDSSLRSVVFSELTIDAPPGTDGSWVELYNRGNTPVDLEGVQVIANGTSVVTFPAATVLGPDVLLLVRFSGDCAALQRAEEPNWRPVTCVPFEAPAVARTQQQVTARKPGFCALVGSREDDEMELRDYVRWGVQSYLPEDDFWVPKARELGIATRGREFPEDRPGLSPEQREFFHQANVRTEAVYVGTNLRLPGGWAPRAGQAAIVRWAFAGTNDRLGSFFPWGVIGLGDTTPGRGNSRLPGPITLVPNPSLTAVVSVKVYLRRLWADLRERKDLGSSSSVRVQVATDQHFLSAAIDRSFPQPPTLALQSELPPGRYYIRAMWQVGARSSDWSEALCVTVKEPKPPAPPPEEAQGRLKDDPALPPTAFRELDLLFGEDRLEKGQAGEKKEK
jgi:hypothetical protein